MLLDSLYVFFWDHQKGHLTEAQWKHSFDGAKKAAHSALAQQNTPVVLSIVFSRIYTLRNQTMHGSATCQSGVNRYQIRDCVAILAGLVPVVPEIIMDNSRTLWGVSSCLIRDLWSDVIIGGWL